MGLLRASADAVYVAGRLFARSTFRVISRGAIGSLLAQVRIVQLYPKPFALAGAILAIKLAFDEALRQGLPSGKLGGVFSNLRDRGYTVEDIAHASAQLLREEGHPGAARFAVALIHAADAAAREALPGAAAAAVAMQLAPEALVGVAGEGAELAGGAGAVAFLPEVWRRDP